MFKKHNCLDYVKFVGGDDPFKNKVKCHECACWLDKEDAQSVEHCMFNTFKNFYCKVHKKPYSRVIHAYNYGAGSMDRYYGEVRMEEDGTPYGYKKK